MIEGAWIGVTLWTILYIFLPDEEANVWIVTSPDVTGSVLESETLDILMQRVKDNITELLELNSPKTAKIISDYEEERFSCAPFLFVGFSLAGENIQSIG